MDKNIREAQERAISRRNEENAKIETLTQEQHGALSDLCAIRHKLHTSQESLWNPDAPDFDLWDYVCETGRHPIINQMLIEVNLPIINFADYTDCPCSFDYFEELEQDERDEWEEKAEEANKNNPKAAFPHSGWTLWREESGRYDDFYETLESINALIEDYLAEIDRQHGTNYCPTGAARLRDFVF